MASKSQTHTSETLSTDKTEMTLTTDRCRKFVEVEHKETGERVPATVTTDGTVVDVDGRFNGDEWVIKPIVETM